MTEKLYLHPLAERIWHWVQALLIIVLLLSGMQIHWPEHLALFGDYSWAVTIHNIAGIILVFLFLIWLIASLYTRRIAHYLMRRHEIYPGLIVQARYYIFDIFRNRPHPYSASIDNKFNPLQKLTYFTFMLIMMPLLLISGLLYLFPVELAVLIEPLGGLKIVGTVHFCMAILFAAFLVAHIYLATTGHTVLADFISMITGYADKEEAQP